MDVYFDNVGGPMTDAVMQRLAFKARVVVCGNIHHYTLTEPYVGPSHLRYILINRARVEGFLVLDWLDRYPEAFARLAAWLDEGRIVLQGACDRGAGERARGAQHHSSRVATSASSWSRWRSAETMSPATTQTGVNAPESTVVLLIEDIFGALGFTGPERAGADRDPAGGEAARATIPTG